MKLEEVAAALSNILMNYLGYKSLRNYCF